MQEGQGLFHIYSAVVGKKISPSMRTNGRIVLTIYLFFFFVSSPGETESTECKHFDTRRDRTEIRAVSRRVRRLPATDFSSYTG